jgi:hypothetical protein
MPRHPRSRRRPVSNAEVAGALREMALFLEMQGMLFTWRTPTTSAWVRPAGAGRAGWTW